MASSEKIKPGNRMIESDHYGYNKDFRTALPQFIAVSVKNLLLLGYGMTLGFTTILIPAVRDPKDGEILHLKKTEISWISSINLIVVPLGCALSGVVTTPIGRRRAMQMVNLPFLVAWLVFHFAQTTGSLYAALCLTGLAGGLLEAPVLTYVAEITQPHLRGALSATSSMCIIIGVFTQFLFGLFLYWRTVALVNISLTILSVVSLCFIPESPHWLVSRGRLNEAKKSLHWLRGWKKSSAIDRELADIMRLYEKNPNEKEKNLKGDNKDTLWNDLSCYTEKSFLLPFFLVSYAFFVGHFSGMTTLQTYAVSIFQMLEAPIDKYYATLILGLLQILGSALCVLLVHYTGKRPLTLFSTAGAAVCCVLVASYDAYIRTCGGIPEISPFVNGTDTNLTSSSSDIITARNPHSWMPTVLLMLLALITHTGIRLLPWILIGEVFSSRTRSGGAGLAGAVGYIFGFLTNKMYISMVDSLYIVGTYGFYGVVCATGCVVFYFILPETEGKKLNDIESHFAGIKKLTNHVYKSKGKQVLEMNKVGAVNPSFEEDISKL